VKYPARTVLRCYPGRVTTETEAGDVPLLDGAFVVRVEIRREKVDEGADV
jgi:hypothetical protein